MKSKAKASSAKHKIENQGCIGEVETKSYEVLRLKRIKYFGNEYHFIDVRFYQCNPGEEENLGKEVYYPTKRGFQIKESSFRKLIDSFVPKSK